MPSAQSIIQHILRAIPGELPSTTCDTFKSGDPDADVRGIVVTFTATRRVLDQAVALGANFIVTHEPTYYTHMDERPGDLVDDPVVLAKKKFIESNGLTIWRCHDSWHKLQPDGILTGMIRALGWVEKQISPGEPFFELPETTLGSLVSEVKQKLGIASVRVIGSHLMKVRRVAFSAGAPGWDRHRRFLRAPGVDVLVCGEQREWETCEYVRDSTAAGHAQGLVILGHANSEEAGMQYLAEWLKEREPAVPIHFVPAGDPFDHR